MRRETVVIYTTNAALAAIPLLLGSVVGAYYGKPRKREDNWYASLEKPVYTPPSAAFGIVWPFLYLCLGVAVFFPAVAIFFNRSLSLQSRIRSACVVYLALALHLASNLTYSPLMFRARNLPASALVAWLTFFTVIVLLILLLFGVKSLSWTTDKTIPEWIAGGARVSPWLLVPYIMWTAFASVLSTHIALLNDEQTA